MRLESTSEWECGSISLFLLEAKDVNETYVEWLNDIRVNRYLESRFVRHSLESTRNYVDSVLSSPHSLLFGIHSLALGRHVGNIKLGPIDLHHGLGEIGLMIGDSKSWGQGIGSSAIRAVSTISSTQLGLRKITAGCYSSNTGSARAFQRAGFTIEAIRKRHFLLDERSEDLVLMAKFL